MPNAGPVLPYGITPSTNGQQQPNLQIVPQPPGTDWGPADIVSGFLEASASFVGRQRVAREYLTPTASRGWQPGWTATVFKDGPAVLGAPRYTSSRAAASGTPSRGTPSARATASASSTGPDAASVTVGGNVQATLYGSGTYAVASATPKARKTFTYDLVMYHGQWRISNLNGNPLLLTRPEFTADYQLRNLYFFDPSGQYLVPDPVYVPLLANQEDLMNALVGDLITQPADWLGGGATRTAFPKGTTRLGNVVVDGGTASVYLRIGGAASRVTTTVKEQISAQLLLTLSGSGQGQQQVRSVALAVNGTLFNPPDAQENPVQSNPKYKPLAGFGRGFYYVDSRGQLMHQQDGGTSAAPVKVGDIGKGYSALAVSPDGDYVAALHGGQVYTGAAGARSPLSLRAVGGGVTSLSWDGNDDLWVTGTNGIYLLTASAKPSTPAVPVAVLPSNCASADGVITALRVAPDGVRVAIVYGGQQPTLAFGAIDMQEGSQPGHLRPLVTVSLSPFCVPGTPGSSFRAVSWFGADDVIALGEPGDALIEYPVNGGTPAPIQSLSLRPGIQSITASGGSGSGLIVSTGSTLYLTPSLTGAWTSVPSGKLAAYPG